MSVIKLSTTVSISKVLINPNISRDEIVSVNKILKEHNDMKEEINH